MTARWCKRGAAALAVATSLVATATGEARAEEPVDAPRRGAVAPAMGERRVTAAGGLLFAFPYGLASATVGTGFGTSVTAAFESLAVLGWSASGRIGWATGLEGGWALGGSAFVERASLSASNGLFGIEFQNMALGNDWIAGGEVMATIDRERGADLTFGLGVSWTLGGPRYLDFDRVETQWDPGLRNVFASVSGEWILTERASLFIELEALVPLHTDLVPLGYLPTASSGITWSFR